MVHSNNNTTVSSNSNPFEGFGMGYNVVALVAKALLEAAQLAALNRVIDAQIQMAVNHAVNDEASDIKNEYAEKASKQMLAGGLQAGGDFANAAASFGGAAASGYSIHEMNGAETEFNNTNETLNKTQTDLNVDENDAFASGQSPRDTLTSEEYSRKLSMEKNSFDPKSGRVSDEVKAASPSEKEDFNKKIDSARDNAQRAKDSAINKAQVRSQVLSGIANGVGGLAKGGFDIGSATAQSAATICDGNIQTFQAYLSLLQSLRSTMQTCMDADNKQMENNLNTLVSLGRAEVQA